MKWIRRALVVVAALPVLGAAILLVAARREGAGESTARIEIRRPLEEVFKHVEDPERLRRWTGVSELQPLTPPPLQRGFRFRTVTLRRGQRNVALAEVAGFTRNESIAMEVRSAEGAPAPFVQTARYRFEGDSARCRVTLIVRTRFDSWLLRLLEPLISPGIQRELERLLRTLKAQVESEAKGDEVPVRGPADPGRP